MDIPIIKRFFYFVEFHIYISGFMCYNKRDRRYDHGRNKRSGPYQRDRLKG